MNEEKPKQLDLIANQLADYAKLLYVVKMEIDSRRADSGLAEDVMRIYEHQIKDTIREGNKLDDAERRELAREGKLTVNQSVNWSMRDCDYTRIRAMVVDYLTELDIIIRYGETQPPRREGTNLADKERIAPDTTTETARNVARIMETGFGQRAVALESREEVK